MIHTILHASPFSSEDICCCAETVTVNNAERVGLWDDRKNAPVQIADDDVAEFRLKS